MENIQVKTIEDYENDEQKLSDCPIWNSPYITSIWDENDFSPEALVKQFKDAGFGFNTDTVTVYKLTGDDLFSIFDDDDIDWDNLPEVTADTIFYVLKEDELNDVWKNRYDNGSHGLFRVYSKLVDMITEDDDDDE
jgi:hypothetical protein